MKISLGVLIGVGIGLLGVTQEAHAGGPPVCGDGNLEGTEECDDGNMAPGDGCSPTCKLEPWILQVCSTARDGSQTLNTPTTLNTYFASPTAESTLAAGARQITLGARSGAPVAIRAGDRLVVIQMQGAQIDPGAAINAGGPYGDGPMGNDRAGAIASTVQAGVYELVLAVADAAAGGRVFIRGAGPGGGLVNPYVNSRVVTGGRGFQTYQVIRIPQLDNLTLNAGGTVTALPWDGSVGGVAVVDVVGTLAFNGGGIDASARGYRGGQAVSALNPDPVASHDKPGFPGNKGEGFAGSPRLLYSSFANQLITGTALGYPTPVDEGPGAPGNAGGNARQSDDSAGGGGGNGGAGGIGGRGGGANAPNRGNSGRGGAPYHGPGVIMGGAQRVSMGGGGGGASGDDLFTDPVVGPRAGSGRNGGGVVIVRATAVTVTGAGSSVLANGDLTTITAQAEGGGGGGGGGTVVIYTNGANLGTLPIGASGGPGTNMELNDDGGGGGGGGGIVYRIGTTGGTVSSAGGAGGISVISAGQYNGLAGADGISDTPAAPATLACEFDRDTDHDGVLDSDDKCMGGDDGIDFDGDGVPDGCDLDDDNDGVPDTAEGSGVDPSRDSDGDLIPDYRDPNAPGFVDANGDGIDDRYDLDGDGVPNHQDLDSDGDGLSDITEGGGADANHDGKVDGFTDADKDGYDDSSESAPLPLPDHDGDGKPDFLDVDDDGDGINTANEAPDANGNHSPDDAQDSDGDGTPDYLDVDDDGDGINTANEAPDGNGNHTPDDAQDSDGDGKPDYLDTDDDGDGVPTSYEEPDGNGNHTPDDARDTDGDGKPDYLDTDDDGDGLSTADESPDPDGDANPDDALDSDRDGIPDYLDPSNLGGRFGYSGGACAAGSGSAQWLGLLLVIGVLAAARRRRAAVLAVLVAALGWPAASQAEIDLDRYTAPASLDDGIALSRPTSPGHLRAGAFLSLEYANDPLVVEDVIGDKDSERLSVVANHLVGHLGGYVGLGRRGMVFIGLPIHLAMSGDSPMDGISADGAGVGDPAIGGRYGLVRRQRFGLAAQGVLTLPLASAADSGDSFGGSSSVTFAPSLLAELGLGRVARVNLAVGLRLREEAPLENTKNGSELTFGAGLAVPVYMTNRTAITAHAELNGASGLAAFASREETPIELLLGVKSRLRSGLSVGLAAGPGLQRGIGSPDYRLLAMLGWTRPEREEAPVIIKKVIIVDTDGDGLLDPDDKCPTQPEDKDAFEDSDGCPDPDNDQDGVLDVADGAPNVPEDKDGFEDGDGVPDPDNDKDGLADAGDKCMNEPEDMDGFEDGDGCPDPDNDKDTVADISDECPTAPGKPENKGCPIAVRIDDKAGKILILKKVEFATNKDIILARSFPLLQEVAETITANPQLKRLRVEGHTDSDGPDAYNLDLSRRRAKSVVKWLIDKASIDPSRLEGYGCGETIPIASNKTVVGKQENRRVEFFIVDPAPSTPDARDASKCMAAQ